VGCLTPMLYLARMEARVPMCTRKPQVRGMTQPPQVRMEETRGMMPPRLQYAQQAPQLLPPQHASCVVFKGARGWPLCWGRGCSGCAACAASCNN
jgi:hypothetical protein